MTAAATLLANLFAAAGVVFSANVAIPQLAKLVKTRRTEGLSATTVAFTCISSVAWGSYGVAHHVVLLGVSSGLVLAAQLPTLILLRRAGAWQGRSQCAAAALSALYLAIGFAGGWAALSGVLVAQVVIQYSPQIVTAFRSERVDGLSERSAQLLLATGCAWGLSGAFGGQYALVCWGVVVAVAGILILIRLHRIPAALATHPV